MPFVSATAAGTDKKAWTPFSPETASSPLFIDAATWHSVNLYVTNGTRLPENMPQADISGAYALVRAHTKKWRDTTFPRTLVVADGIVDYAGKAPRYFDELATAGKTLDAAADGTPAYESSRNLMIAILGRLITDAQNHAAATLEVKGLVLEFRSQTMDDQTEIKKLNKKYTDEFGDASQKSQDLLKEMADIRAQISSLNDDYIKAVVTASTTPTYAWIYPAGTIAAAVVAGVFSDRAIKIKEQIARAKDQLELLTGEQKRRVELIAILRLASESTSGIEKSMGSAIAGLDKAANAWSAIAGDMANLRKTIEGLRGSFDMYFVDIPLIKQSWHNVGVKADAYRAHAFCTVT
jgi:hypothetical protein